MNIKINHLMTHLPLSETRGTVQERLARTIQRNDRAFEGLESCFEYGKMKTGIFKDILKKNSSKEISIQIEDSPSLTSSTAYFLNATPEGIPTIEGYTMKVPVESFTRKIEKKSIKSLMKEAFTYFYTISNPKLIARDIKILNKGYDTKELSKIIDESTFSTKGVSEIEIDRILAGRSAQEKIDLLQKTRYHWQQCLAHVETSVRYQVRNNKLVKLKKLRKEYKKYEEFNLPQKIALIEEKLASIIKNERAQMANNR